MLWTCSHFEIDPVMWKVSCVNNRTCEFEKAPFFVFQNSFVIFWVFFRCQRNALIGWIKFYLIEEFLHRKKISKKWLHQRKLFKSKLDLLNFLIFSSSINELAALQCILPSCYSKNRSAGKFNVGRVNLDGISKIWVNVIGFDPTTNYSEGKHSTI